MKKRTGGGRTCGTGGLEGVRRETAGGPIYTTGGRVLEVEKVLLLTLGEVPAFEKREKTGFSTGAACDDVLAGRAGQRALEGTGEHTAREQSKAAECESKLSGTSEAREIYVPAECESKLLHCAGEGTTIYVSCPRLSRTEHRYPSNPIRPPLSTNPILPPAVFTCLLHRHCLSLLGYRVTALQARGDASEDNYSDNRAAFLELAPDADIPSFHQVRKLISNLTGIHALRVDMCPNSCVAFTGPFEDLTECPRCREPRYDPVALEHGRSVSRRTFPTFPLGPQLQSMWASPENATLMRHRARETERILRVAGEATVIDDVYYGNDYLALATTPEPREDGTPRPPVIGPDDTVLMFSIDGAQLYLSKGSDCWFYIWVLLDLPPTVRYKKRYVLPGAVIPGPNKPKNVDSFLFPGLYHLAAVQREGLQIWDAAERRQFRSRLYLLLVTADSPAMAYMNGLVGHTGMNMCRLYCGREGRHKPNLGTYYPALLRPDGDVNGPVDFSLRVDDSDPDSISPSQRYHNNLLLVRAARTEAEYARTRLDTGIAKPSIFSGLPKRRFLGVPGGFVLDLMHLITLNLTDLFIALLRGTMACDPTDDKRTWTWAIFRDRAAWQAHGRLVGASARYLPMSFDRPPRNPAEKISSGYKAWEYLLYVYGLLPGFLRHVQTELYYRHFCLAVSAVRVVLQYRQNLDLLPPAQRDTIHYIEQYEDLYYQRRFDRLHFVRPSLHTFGHIIPEIFRVGPGALHTQWTMENYIGNITREIKQHVTPYANVGERALRRCQINALKAMLPDLAEPDFRLPSGALDLGRGYALLHATDRVERRVTPAEAQAIHAYLRAQGVALADPNWEPIVRRWARLAIPSQQVARSAWKEEAKERRGKQPRRSRMVKVCPFVLVPGCSL